jgi:hypothetical protein
MYQLVHMLPFLSSSNNIVFIVYPLHNYIKIKQKSGTVTTFPMHSVIILFPVLMSFLLIIQTLIIHRLQDPRVNLLLSNLPRDPKRARRLMLPNWLLLSRLILILVCHLHKQRQQWIKINSWPILFPKVPNQVHQGNHMNLQD